MKLGEMFDGEVVTAQPQDSLATVASLMEQHNVAAVVVVEDQKPVGLMTERDLALSVAARGTSPLTPVGRVMTTPVATIDQGLGVFSATQYMMNYEVRRLPVVDEEGRLVGMITLDDLLGLLGRELYNLAEGIKPQAEVPWHG